jgi:hypothetical protein
MCGCGAFFKVYTVSFHVLPALLLFWPAKSVPKSKLPMSMCGLGSSPKILWLIVHGFCCPSPLLASWIVLFQNANQLGTYAAWETSLKVMNERSMSSSALLSSHPLESFVSKRLLATSMCGSGDSFKIFCTRTNVFSSLSHLLTFSSLSTKKVTAIMDVRLWRLFQNTLSMDPWLLLLLSSPGF